MAKNLSNGLPTSTKGKGIAFDLVAVALGVSEQPLH